jgi:hypothetical protein
MKNIQTELKWSVLFTAMSIAWIFLEKLVGLHDELIEHHPIYTNLYAIPAILFYILALKEKKANFYKSHFKYKNAVVSGLILTFMITLLAPLGTYVSVEYVSPDFFENAILKSVEMNYYTAEEASEYFNTSNYMLQSLMFTPVFGIVTTLIVAIFVRSK